MSVLVSNCRVVAFVGWPIAVEGPSVRLGGTRRVGCVVLVCRARAEAVVEVGAVRGTVASGGGAKLPAVLPSVDDDVTGRGDVVGVMAVVVLVVETRADSVAFRVFSSVT